MAKTTNEVAVLPAADAMGKPLNGSHRVQVDEVQGISVAGPNGEFSTVLVGEHMLAVALSSYETSKLLGWEA